MTDAPRSTPRASQSLADATHPEATPEPSVPQRRRISYFMLVRLVILAMFTVVAGLLAVEQDRTFGALYHGFVWGTLVVGYGLTILFARLLPRVRDLDRFAWVQTTTDILLSAVVVQVSGGAESGFVSLYLIAILGAATMGGVSQTWAAAGACGLIYGTTSLLQVFDVIEPVVLGMPAPKLPPGDLLAAVARTLAALLGVAVLSSFLNRQIATSSLKLDDLRAMNENVLLSLNSGLIAVDNQAKITYFNPAARSILQLTDQDLEAPVEDLMPGVEDLLDPPSAISHPHPRPRPREHERAQLEVQTREGHRVHVGLSCGPLRDSQGRRLGQLINFQDVSRVHELAAQVRRNERLAAVGSLAASVAHEIRNPLAAISGSAELLGAAALEDEDTRLLSIIRRESTRLSELITDMLTFTRPRPPQRVRASLARIAAEALETFRNDPGHAGVEVSLHDQGVPEVEVDPDQLSQVLWNLLRNAAEAAGDDGGHIDVTVGTLDDGRVELSVVDDGPGIPAEQRDQVFDPFFTTKEGGTGFGLATVHRIVQDNGGEIELESAPGRGTTFRVSFDAAEPEG